MTNGRRAFNPESGAEIEQQVKGMLMKVDLLVMLIMIGD